MFRSGPAARPGRARPTAGAAGFLAEAARHNHTSGAALVSLLRVGDALYVAGAGDARAVLFSETGVLRPPRPRTPPGRAAALTRRARAGQGEPIPLCEAHRPHLAGELARISQLGGPPPPPLLLPLPVSLLYTHSGDHRGEGTVCRNQRISGVLAVSRGSARARARARTPAGGAARRQSAARPAAAAWCRAAGTAGAHARPTARGARRVGDMPFKPFVTAEPDVRAVSPRAVRRRRGATPWTCSLCALRPRP